MKVKRGRIYGSHLVINPEIGTVDRVLSNGDIIKNAGSRQQGYVRIGVNGKVIGVHRLIYEHVHGPIPAKMVIDHINGIRDDNRIENLRLVSYSGNANNRTKGRSTVQRGWPIEFVKAVTNEPVVAVEPDSLKKALERLAVLDFGV